MGLLHVGREDPLGASKTSTYNDIQQLRDTVPRYRSPLDDLTCFFSVKLRAPEVKPEMTGRRVAKALGKTGFSMVFRFSAFPW